MTYDFEKRLIRLINQEIFANQSYLVERLLQDNPDFIEDIENLYINDSDCEDPEFQEIFEWWLISDWLAAKLKERKEPILENDFGTWWGRTCTGQAIKMDSVIIQIVRDLD